MTRRAAYLLFVPAVTALALSPAGAAQGSSPGGGDAMHVIQTNPQRITPPPCTVDIIKQEMRQRQATPVARAGSRARSHPRSQDGQESQSSGPPGSQESKHRTDGLEVRALRWRTALLVQSSYPYS